MIPPRRGFTLIELMVVIAIIAILAMIAVPQYHTYVLRTKIRGAQSDLMALSAHIENYRQRTLAYPQNDMSLDQLKSGLGWSPASRPQDFDFSYTAPKNAATQTGYSLRSIAKEPLGIAQGCQSIYSQGQQTVSAECASVGVTGW